MSNLCPPSEILDCIIDLLHDQPKTLERCCLVSKSWIPRTRKHLFAEIIFHDEKRLKLWKKTFPDPSTSPAHYAKTLFVGRPQAVVAADAEPGGWIRGFSGVVNLMVGSQLLPADRSIYLVPLHGLSPGIKSLHVTVPALPPSRIINLISSFPLLEDLVVHVTTSESYGIVTDDADSPDRSLTSAQPSSSPTFTGSLALYIRGGMQPITHRLLSLQIGIHFRRLALTWSHEEDHLATTALVERCSHTLECLVISDLSGASI
jgi:hypothetical protein